MNQQKKKFTASSKHKEVLIVKKFKNVKNITKLRFFLGNMKLYSMGYTYIVDKKNANTINWKCDHCKGRATSWNEARIGARSNPRVEITRPHTHAPNLALRSALIQRQQLKNRALSSRDAPRRILREVNSELDPEALCELPSEKASKQYMNRLKAANEKYGQNAATRKEIVIPRAFKVTLSKKKFYFDDSDDDDRIMLFVTQESLDLMSKHQDWLCDGTFDITPLLYKQLFTIHIIYKGILMVIFIVLKN